MKFLFLTQYFPPEIGAAPTRLNAMAQELKELGHEVEVVTAMPNYPKGEIFDGYKWSFYRRELRQGIPVHRVWLYASVGGGIQRMLNYATFTLTSLFALFRAQKPDYLFVESPPLILSLAAFAYSVTRRVPFILNVADLWPDTIVQMGLLGPGLVLRILSRLELWSYRKAAFVNAVTSGIRDALINEKNVPPEKVLFLVNGADTRRFRPEPADPGKKQQLGLQGKRVILYSGTMGRAHGLEHVLAAAKLLEAELDVHFLFLGDGSERAKLIALRDELNLGNVSFHDPVPVEELPPFHAIADAGLVSLRDVAIFEGARPSKIFPLLASGKPLFYCGYGEGARLIETANAGVVIAPENPQALANAVVALFRDEARLRQLGANGRAFVEEHHSWAKLVSDWLRALPLPTSRVSPTPPSLKNEIAS